MISRPCYMIVLALCLAFACTTDTSQVEPAPEYVVRDSIVCYSLFAKPLKYPRETTTSFALKDSLLTVARIAYENDSKSLNNIIWYGRRLGYLSEYPRAMSVYTRGLHLHPGSPELYRHRGHRYLSIRRFDEAANDLLLAANLARGRAVEVEEDGIPNALNTPLSSLQFNIWYHLGLAYYYQGDYQSAATAFDSCMTVSTNDDLLCATTQWYQLTSRRLGDSVLAERLLNPINSRMTIVENDGYHELLLLFKGQKQPEDLISLDTSNVSDEHHYATVGYGVAQYLKLNGRAKEAEAVLKRILNGPSWSSFGYIAAEADASRGLQ